MRPRSPIELTREDVVTSLGSLASRLRLHAHAVRGMAAREGAGSSTEARAKAELAEGLEAVAVHLELLRGQLCPCCRTIEVLEQLQIGESGE